jgi:hypothetical protein
LTSWRYRNGDHVDAWDEPEPEPRGNPRLGFLILAVSSTLAAVLVVGAGLYALALIGRAPRPRPAPPATAAQRNLAALARSYLAIAGPSDKRLDTEEDAYADHEKDNLAAARASLRQQVATERQFDTQLAAINFPPALENTARALTVANQRRFRVTLRQARSATLPRLRSLDAQRKAGDAAVEVEVRLLREQLRLPPPSSD